MERLLIQRLSARGRLQRDLEAQKGYDWEDGSVVEPRVLVLGFALLGERALSERALVLALVLSSRSQ